MLVQGTGPDPRSGGLRPHGGLRSGQPPKAPVRGLGRLDPGGDAAPEAASCNLRIQARWPPAGGLLMPIIASVSRGFRGNGCARSDV